MTWNDYTEKEGNYFTIISLRLAGMAVLAFLVFKFKSGQPENDGSLITGWWGILGLIGWGYVVSAFIYLFSGDKIINIVVAFLFFLTMNILDKSGTLSSLNGVRPLLGVIIEGNVPMIVLSGVIASLILKAFSGDHKRIILVILGIGVLSLVAGFVLRHWFIISKIQATPSWGLICNGISFFLFAALYYIIDVKKTSGWASFSKPAGENSLTTYLAPNVLYYLIWMSSAPVLIYKNSQQPLVVIAGSIAWALLMVLLTKVLVRFGIKLKL
jgi:predicted acyltransferase